MYKSRLVPAKLNLISCDPVRSVTTHITVVFIPPYKTHIRLLHVSSQSDDLPAVLVLPRQMRFNPWSEPVVLYNDVASSRCFLVVVTAWENEISASGCSAHTHG